MPSYIPILLWKKFATKKNYFRYQVTVTAGQATTPKFTFGAGAPAAVVDWGDGTAQSAVTSGVELNHAYTVGGTYTVTLIAPNQAKYLTQIDIGSDKVSQVLTPIHKFPKLTYYQLNNNSAWVQNISGWVMPPSIVYLWLRVCPLIGDISGWVVPASQLYFWVHSTSLSGCPNLDSMVSIQQIRADDTALIQASVDLYLSRCVANEGDTTFATPTLNLGGTNQAPSAAGLLDKATLVAAGWIVTTN